MDFKFTNPITLYAILFSNPRKVGVTSPRTMKLLPEKKLKSQQKISVADQTGIIQCFGLKKGEVVVSVEDNTLTSLLFHIVLQSCV